MKLFGDFHTHTIYSCGKRGIVHATGTILQNAKQAKAKGLSAIGITEHGFGHVLYGLQKKDIAKMKEEIASAEAETGIKIHFGIESNIISSKGDIDLTEEEIKEFDFIIVGFHKFAKAKNFKEFLFFKLPNLLKFKCKRVKERNTNALCQAMQKYPIDIISHPGAGFALNFEKLAQAAKETNTLLELNGKRIAYENIDFLINNGNRFIMNSDAHSPSRVGEVNKPMNYLIKNNIPTSLVVNINKNFNEWKKK
ncbi:MAG: PHP domain-containing protein [Clostridia bacterium]|nr:PHP domain-containing protein [Clostridia bacterium]